MDISSSNLRNCFAWIWHKAELMRLELTLAGLLVKLANHYTTWGTHGHFKYVWIVYLFKMIVGVNNIFFLEKIYCYYVW